MTTERSRTTAQSQSDTPIACTLPEDELAERLEGVGADIIGGVEESNELPDGYELRFPGSAEWASKVTQFIANERACCSFLEFELVFEANQGPIWLRLRGPEGAKEFMKVMLSPADA
ncbi:MAG: hypothetical protein IIA23_02855 [Chloroflexi bacterium]|nr:hypothetical protein [Chloroflexota bacterium]